MDDLNEYWKMKDIMCARSLGYNTEFVREDELIDYQMTNLFDYKKKTEEYIKSIEYYG